MKYDVQEVAALEKVVSEVKDGLTELSELQLVVIGGGVGEVVIA